MNALLKFPPGHKSTALHRAALWNEWLVRARLQRLTVDGAAMVVTKDKKTWTCAVPLQYEGNAAETWIKQLPLPKDATLEFQKADPALPSPK